MRFDHEFHLAIAAASNNRFLDRARSRSARRSTTAHVERTNADVRALLASAPPSPADP